MIRFRVDLGDDIFRLSHFEFIAWTARQEKCRSRNLSAVLLKPQRKIIQHCSTTPLGLKLQI